MHDLNLLPETETVRRQSRLLTLTTIGVTIAAGIWVGSTHTSNQAVITQLEESIRITENQMQPIPELQERVEWLQGRLSDHEPILEHLRALPAATADTSAALQQALATFAADDEPDISLDRITAERNAGVLTVTVAGRALTAQPIQDRFTRLQQLGLVTTAPDIRVEEDDRLTFEADLTLPLASTTPSTTASAPATGEEGPR